MYTFKVKNDYSNIKVKVEAEEFSTLVEGFVNFALACGYQPETIKQYIDIYGDFVRISDIQEKDFEDVNIAD